MSNEIVRPAGGYTYVSPWEAKPTLPVFPAVAGRDTKTVAGLISQYLAEVADVSIRTTYTTADTLNLAAEKAAINGGNMMVDVMGDNPIVADWRLLGIPEPSINLNNVDGDFNGTLTKIKEFMDGLENSWLMRYFPAALPDGLDPLLEMVTGGTIVSDAMQEIMWERAKQQTTRDSSRAKKEAINQWAGRGFSLPGGALTSRIDRINQDLQFTNADLAAQQAIKALDIQVDTVKFAAEIGTQLRLGLINGFTGLVSAYSRLPSAATEYATGIANAKRALYSATNDYYRMQLDNSGLRLQADQTNTEMHQRYLQTAASFMGQYMSTQVQATAAATDSYAKIAAQVLANVNAVTQIGIESIS